MDMEKITNESHIRLKNKPTKIYKVLSISDSGEFIDARQKDKIRVSLNYSDVEPASDEDKFTYEDDSTTINYDE